VGKSTFGADAPNPISERERIDHLLRRLQDHDPERFELVKRRCEDATRELNPPKPVQRSV
jgi:hypothetical protein